MAVYIFPVDAAEINKEEPSLHAGTIEVAVKALDLAIVRDAKPDYRETTKKVFEAEVDKGSSLVIVDSSLPFKAADIDDDFSFGNGTTVGSVRLKTGEWIQCGWSVFDHADKSKVDAKLTALKNIFKGLT
ncbi:hypothetical protein KAU93_04075 [Candidatus Bathyarchaeota archaeon]|nr:hypothetical protein [Candidatus Bathyarchaeota archaeon]